MVERIADALWLFIIASCVLLLLTGASVMGAIGYGLWMELLR